MWRWANIPSYAVWGNDYPTPDGTPIRDYIHVVDLAIGHVRALENLSPETGYTIYNLGTGRGYSVLEVIHAFEKVWGKELPIGSSLSAAREIFR